MKNFLIVVNKLDGLIDMGYKILVVTINKTSAAVVFYIKQKGGKCRRGYYYKLLNGNFI